MSEDLKNTNEHGDDAGYEEQDVRIGRTALFILLGSVMLIAILVLLNEYFLAVKEEVVYEEVLKPESRSLMELRAREDSILTTYGVADSVKGLYRMPIDKAMEKMITEHNQIKKSEKSGK